MTLTIDLPAELEGALADEAARAGLSLPEYVVRLLTSARPPAGDVQSGAALVAYWQAEGVIGTRGDIADAAAHARDLRQQAERRP